MIGPATGRALDLMRGIEIWRETGEKFWHDLVVRILMDLDRDGAHDQTGLIADLLGCMWCELPVLEQPRRPLDWPLPEPALRNAQGGG